MDRILPQHHSSIFYCTMFKVGSIQPWQRPAFCFWGITSYRGFGLENQAIAAKSTVLFVHVMLDLTKSEPLRWAILIFKYQRLQFEKLSIYMHIHKPIKFAAEVRGNDTCNSFRLTFLCRPKVVWKSLFISQEFCKTEYHQWDGLQLLPEILKL